MRYTQAQVKELWIDNGGGRGLAKVMSAVAFAENTEDENGTIASDAINDNPATGDYSVGFWQINYYGNLRASRTKAYGSPEELRQDVTKQVKAAKSIAAGGAGLSAWSTYRDGTYLQYMGKGAASSDNLPDQSNKDADSRQTWAEKNIPGVGAVGDIADVVRFLYEEHGLIRIAEVVLGFGALTLGFAALMIDAASKSPVGQVALAATGVGRAAATGGKVRNTVSKVADAKPARGNSRSARAVRAAETFRENKDSKNFEKRYGMTEEEATKMSKGDAPLPKRAIVHDEPIYHKGGRTTQSEGARRRQAHSALKKRHTNA